MEHLADPPTLKEIIEAINRMKNDNAPGASGIAADAFKNLSTQTIKVLHSSIVENGDVIPN
jgi:hypothetical protein